MDKDHFIDQLRVFAALSDTPATDRTLAAFRSVAREEFAGPGPWQLRTPFASVTEPPMVTPDADPKWLYHSVLVVLDADKGINIGDPSLWAGLLAQTDVQPGMRVLQVGVGVGYYSAVLSHLVGPTGHVTGYEVEGTLAAQATQNLAAYDNVTIHHGNAATDLTGAARYDLIVAFAGVTHIPSNWAKRLSTKARLLLPLTGDDWWGAMILAHQTAKGFRARTLGRCGFYPCHGARHADLSTRVSTLFQDPARLKGCHLRITGSDDATRIQPE